MFDFHSGNSIQILVCIIENLEGQISKSSKSSSESPSSTASKKLAAVAFLRWLLEQPEMVYQFLTSIERPRSSLSSSSQSSAFLSSSSSSFSFSVTETDQTGELEMQDNNNNASVDTDTLSTTPTVPTTAPVPINSNLSGLTVFHRMVDSIVKTIHAICFDSFDDKDLLNSSLISENFRLPSTLIFPLFTLSLLKDVEIAQPLIKQHQQQHQHQLFHQAESNQQAQKNQQVFESSLDFCTVSNSISKAERNSIIYLEEIDRFAVPVSQSLLPLMTVSMSSWLEESKQIVNKNGDARHYNQSQVCSSPVRLFRSPVGSSAQLIETWAHELSANSSSASASVPSAASASSSIAEKSFRLARHIIHNYPSVARLLSHSSSAFPSSSLSAAASVAPGSPSSNFTTAPATADEDVQLKQLGGLQMINVLLLRLSTESVVCLISLMMEKSIECKYDR